MTLFEDDRPKRKTSHEIGQDISLLSVMDLDDRIDLLKVEIARLETDKIQKHHSKNAAQALFR
jgi:uncharacterized small protein (DUF1192 family)